IAGGVFKKGDKVTLLPSGFSSVISAIETYDGEVREAFPPMSVSIQLEDDLDLSRGDMLVRENNQPQVTQDIDVMVCWFSSKPLQERGKYTLQHTTREVRCMVQNILYKLDINTLHRNQEDKMIGMNDICRLQLRTTQPLFVDTYNRNRITGSLIFIDEATHETVGAGMVI
ncbi:MAG: sulfate adenylyltransferase, partial [Saprospiraceae bacterium]|nr:sulfate adenylyltransferase [Saprospiraceae bacterium]